MQLLLCVKDDGYDPRHLVYLKQLPKKGEIYTLRGRIHGVNGLGYLLDELHNDIMPNGQEANFSSRRFVNIDDETDVDKLLKETLEIAQ